VTTVSPSFLKRLFTAARSGHKDVVAFYIRRGGDLNVTDPHGWTPLHYAVAH
jgi:ankyrin repeat protein